MTNRPNHAFQRTGTVRFLHVSSFGGCPLYHCLGSGPVARSAEPRRSVHEMKMKKELTGLLSEAAELCECSGYTDQANWFRDRIEMIRQVESGEMQTVLEEIQGVLAGMGSFSDLSLCPSPDSGMTREQARLRQWDLVSEMDEAIEKIKKTSNNGFHGTR